MFIDSFSLWIPLEIDEIENYKNEVLTINSTTQEIISVKEHSYIVNQDGIKIRYNVYHRVFGKERGYYLGLFINSKILKENYFNGINIANIHKVHKIVEKLLQIEIDFFRFLNGTLTDTDITEDWIVEEKYIQDIYDYAKQFDEYGLLKTYKGKKRREWYFNERGKSNPDKPYGKFYHKLTEFRYNSAEFYENYIKEVPENMYRWEIGLRNKEMFDNLGIGNRLIDLLQFIDNDENVLFLWDYFINSYITKKKSKMVKLNSKDKMIIKELLEMSLNHYRKDYILLRVLSQFERKERSRKRKELLALIDSIEEKNEKMIQNIEYENILMQLDTIEKLKKIRFDYYRDN